MEEQIINEVSSIKKIIITEPLNSNIKNKKSTKEIKTEKEIKLRVETKTWGLNDEDLNYQTQINSLQNISQTNNAYISKLKSHIKNKIYSYRQQDILKKKFNEDKFVSFEEVVELLVSCNMRCCYCSDNVYILYEQVREMKQWSLDRVDNNIGHNSGNLVIACLECNLKRRRTNKDAFMFTKNMVIIKQG